MTYLNDLEICIEKHGSDKILSEYTPLYEPLFRPLRDNSLSLLEIGIGTLLPEIQSTFIGNVSLYPHYKPGGSLRAWKEYFPNAQIYGVDVGEDCQVDEERIKTFICSSTDEKETNAKLKDLRFDVIIDDGLHTAEGQISTMKNFFYRVNEGGYYIIEDCGGGDGLNVVVDNAKEFRNFADLHEWYFRGNIVVIRKNYSSKGQINNFEEFFHEPYKTTYIKRNEENRIASSEQSVVSNKDLTIVTGLWNIGRPGRDFSHYIEHFKKFLEMPYNLFIFIPAEYEHLVWEKRTKHNTTVKITELEDVKTLYKPFWDKTQEIRTSPAWYNQTGEHGWLVGSPQAHLEWYNPIVQSKMFMLNDVSIWNPFNTEYFIWLDAGITNTVHDKYFSEHKTLDNINPLLDSFLFLSYPYETTSEIHGFNKQAMDRIAGADVKYVCRGGLFGGRKEVIREANATYYSLLNSSLHSGFMGTEESIFSLMAYINPGLYRRYELDGNGLIVKFIQNLHEGNVNLVPVQRVHNKNRLVTPNLSGIKTSLYMLTFNFPEQVEYTIKTWEASSPDWLNKPHRKILIDNSNNLDALQGNKEICERYGFEHIITGENLGINRGRQFAAEHFHDSDSDFYFFFEDDMGFNDSLNTGYCRNGFRKYVPDLYNKVHKIMLRENFDFMKLSYTEVYMDNNIQVSWYNVPQHIRTRDWPDYDKLPVSGLDVNAPRTQFKTIEVFEELSYISGDIYYANWPMIVSKEGNKKMFIDIKWEHPFEQTWMSQMYQDTKKGIINPAVLLASPVWHNRIAYYKPEERREN